MRVDRIKLIAEMARRDMNCNMLCALSGLARGTVTAVRSGKSCSDETATKLVEVLGPEIIDQRFCK